MKREHTGDGHQHLVQGLGHGKFSINNKYQCSIVHVGEFPFQVSRVYLHRGLKDPTSKRRASREQRLGTRACSLLGAGRGIKSFHKYTASLPSRRNSTQGAGTQNPRWVWPGQVRGCFLELTQLQTGSPMHSWELGREGQSLGVRCASL